MAALAAVMAVMPIVSGCGGSDDDDRPAAGNPAPSTAADTRTQPDAEAQAEGDSTAQADAEGDSTAQADADAPPKDAPPIDFSKPVRLTAADRARLAAKAPDPRPYTGHPQDHGSKKHRTELMAAFREMQRLFYSGNFKAYCKKFWTTPNAFIELQPPKGKTVVDECIRLVSITAKEVADGTLRWPNYVARWVRVYIPPNGREPYGGVSNKAGTSASVARMAFIKKRGRWRPEFRIAEMRGLSAR